MLHLYAALAEKERRLISERTKVALAIRKANANGSKLGKPLNLGQVGREALAIPTTMRKPCCPQSQ
jgi:DNA invertase Pin-like site-specific DNA recombinase